MPDPPVRYLCGNGYLRRLDQQIVIDGSQLMHLTRFFERVQDDETISELLVSVRAGTVRFVGPPWMYSAEVGYSEAD